MTERVLSGVGDRESFKKQMQIGKRMDLPSYSKLLKPQLYMAAASETLDLDNQGQLVV